VKTKLVNGAYSFEEILPGRYQLSVPTEGLCWEKHQQSLVVKSTEENVPKFIQSGYKIGPIISSHDCSVSNTSQKPAEVFPYYRTPDHCSSN